MGAQTMFDVGWTTCSHKTTWQCHCMPDKAKIRNDWNDGGWELKLNNVWRYLKWCPWCLPSSPAAAWQASFEAGLAACQQTQADKFPALLKPAKGNHITPLCLEVQALCKIPGDPQITPALHAKHPTSSRKREWLQSFFGSAACILSGADTLSCLLA